MIPTRTAESVEQHAMQPLRNARKKKQKQKNQQQQTQLSSISYFPHFDCVQGIAIDACHY
jgi:hypothetical protein